MFTQGLQIVFLDMGGLNKPTTSENETLTKLEFLLSETDYLLT